MSPDASVKRCWYGAPCHRGLHAQQEPAAEEQPEDGPEDAKDEGSEGSDEEAEEEEPKPEITVSSFHAYTLGSAWGLSVTHDMHGIFGTFPAAQTEPHGSRMTPSWLCATVIDLICLHRSGHRRMTLASRARIRPGIATLATTSTTGISSVLILGDD
jgi:hypothetical protein